MVHGFYGSLPVETRFESEAKQKLAKEEAEMKRIQGELEEARKKVDEAKAELEKAKEKGSLAQKTAQAS